MLFSFSFSFLKFIVGLCCYVRHGLYKFWYRSVKAVLCDGAIDVSWDGGRKEKRKKVKQVFLQ